MRPEWIHTHFINRFCGPFSKAVRYPSMFDERRGFSFSDVLTFFFGGAKNKAASKFVGLFDIAARLPPPTAAHIRLLAVASEH
jgi:hypothetical protein